MLITIETFQSQTDPPRSRRAPGYREGWSAEWSFDDAELFMHPGGAAMLKARFKHVFEARGPAIAQVSFWVGARYFGKMRTGDVAPPKMPSADINGVVIRGARTAVKKTKLGSPIVGENDLRLETPKMFEKRVYQMVDELVAWMRAVRGPS